MVRRISAVAVCLGLWAGVGVAAEPIKIEAKSYQLKSAVKEAPESVQFDEGEGRAAFYTNGTATAEIEVAEDGEYTITFDAACDAAKEKNANIKVSVGDTVVAKEHALTATERKEYSFTAKLKKGKTKFVVEFLNDEYKENEYDRNFYLYDAKIEAKK
jgi:hypothetical protein